MGRRANHEGTIVQRSDGRWEARIRIGDERVSRYGATRGEVVEKLRRLQNTPAIVAANPHLLLSEWMGEWLASLDLRASTSVTYERTLAPIRVELGMVKLARLSPIQLSAVFVLLRERGRGPRRLHLAHGYLKACLARAVALGHLSANPMERVPRPKWTAAEKRYWNLDEMTRFLTTSRASKLRYASLFVLLATTGLRMSEALALESADLERGAVTVRTGQVWDRKTGYVAGDVKTTSSRRTIPVPQVGRDALAAVPFRTQGGLIPRPPLLYATLAALCAEAAVPAVSPHGLRHIHAALAYHATGDVYAVQARLGHKNVTTTMGIYGFGMRADDTTRDALDGLFASTTPPAPAPGANTDPT